MNRIKIYLVNHTTKEIELTDLSVIKEDIFSTRDDIVKVELPEGVRVIGEYAFAECINLEEVICPKTLEIIEREAFVDCICLKKVVCKETVLISPSAFNGCENLA